MSRFILRNFKIRLGLIAAVLLSWAGTASANTSSYKLLQEEKVTLSVSNQDIRVILDEVSNQTQLSFVFTNVEKLGELSSLSINAEDKSVRYVLDELLHGTSYIYTIEGKVVTLKTKPQTVTQVRVEPIKIKGRVLQEGTQKPIPGATIIALGSGNGAITDENGDFIIEMAKADSIEISSMGFEMSKMYLAKSDNSLLINLSESAMDVDDVVVTGVFTRRANTYSGAVSTMKSEDLEKTGSLNIVAALGNLDPSFNVLINNDMGSNPNAVPDIQMRGAGSFSEMKDNYTTSPNQPLFVVDGFESTVTKVMDMDMKRVESITILKDATAKAIYGSKGANGVVVVTTKAPELGKIKLTYKGDLNIQAPVLSDYTRANAAEKLEIERLAGVYTSSNNHPGTQNILDQRYNAIMNEILRGVDTDWLAVPTRVGVGQKHSVILEGGDETFRYDVNLAYNNVAGVMKGSDRNTFEGGINLQYRSKNLLFKNQLSYINNVGKESPYGSFADYAKMNPYWRAYDENGKVNEVLGDYEGLQAYDNMTIYNPVINAFSNYKNETAYNDLTNNFYIEWSVTDDLKLTGRVGVTKYTSQSDVFYPTNYTTLDASSTLNYITVTPEDEENYFNRGLYKRTILERTNFSSDVILSYSKQFGKNLFFLNGQYNISENNSKSTSYEGIGFADNATEITQARQYKESSSPYGYDDTVRELGFLASLNYSYDSRYLFDANYRANASSLFGTNNKWGHFWSVGAGWNVHNEKFLKDANWLDMLKVRGSFGYSGKQNFSAYQAIATYQYFTDDIYDNVVGAYLLSMYNPDLKWELTQDQNIGIDATFGKLDVTVDYYVKNTENLLTPITSVPSIGFSTYIENLGKSKNNGVEGKINYRIISNAKKDTYFSVFGSAAYNKNILVEINEALTSINDSAKDDYTGNSQGSPSASGFSKPTVLYEEGVSLNAIWAVPSLGIEPSTGKEIFVKRDGTRTYTWSADDLQALGDTQAKVQGTFGFNFDYKGFTVNANFAYRYGGQYYNQTLADNVEAADLNYNVDVRVLTDRWNPETPGTASKYTALNRYQYYTKPTSRFIQDMNELSLSSLNVGYDFRNCNFIKESKAIERLRLSFAANELLRFSTVKAERGILYPYAQSFIFTVQATF